MKYPVRGKTCQHVQTFELQSYIEMNFSSKRWLCPICGRSAITLRRCFMTESLLKRVNEFFPLANRIDCDNDKLMEILMMEMNNFGEKPTEEEINDVKGVIIERETLAVIINNKRFYIDTDKMGTVDGNNPEEVEELNEKCRLAFCDYKP